MLTRQHIEGPVLSMCIALFQPRPYIGFHFSAWGWQPARADAPMQSAPRPEPRPTGVTLTPRQHGQCQPAAAGVHPSPHRTVAIELLPGDNYILPWDNCYLAAGGIAAGACS